MIFCISLSYQLQTNNEYTLPAAEVGDVAEREASAESEACGNEPVE